MSPEEELRMQAQLESADSTFKSNWQDQANYIFPRERNITELNWPGTQQFDQLYDTTGRMESERMANGLLTYFIPAGQKFFSLGVSDNAIQEIDVVKSYMAKSTEIEHEEMFTSNMLVQLGETLRSLVVFGTGNLFENWQRGLNYMDRDISRYQIQENGSGVVDTIYLKFPMTATQAVTRWGENAGKSVIEAFNTEKKKYEIFWFLHVVKPREKFNPRFPSSENMPWTSKYIRCKDKTLINEGGYPEFPYQIPRWAKTSGEVHGRGIGGAILPQVKMVNAMKRDINEKRNKGVNPPSEVLQTFEGTYDTTPGAQNDVMEMPSRYIDQYYASSYASEKDELEAERKIIKDAFFHDAFAPLSDLTGDRRNELEIRQRIQEGLRRIGNTRRLESELFTPMIERSYALLVRNGMIPPPPPELQGQAMKVTYRGQLSLAQQDSEASAADAWVEKGLVVGETRPDVMDHINLNSIMRRWGRVGGVNEDDINTLDEVEAIREQRQQALARQQAQEALQTVADSYGKTTKAPEEGSAAEAIGAVSG
jgi:hypothetical protein